MENKLQILCEYLPFGIKCQIKGDNTPKDLKKIYVMGDNSVLSFSDGTEACLADVKPLLRPLSSMTQEEFGEMGERIQENYIDPSGEIKPGMSPLTLCTIRQALNLIKYLREKHFDYAFLIEKGLELYE